MTKHEVKLKLLTVCMYVCMHGCVYKYMSFYACLCNTKTDDTYCGSTPFLGIFV